MYVRGRFVDYRENMPWLVAAVSARLTGQCPMQGQG